MTEQDAEKVMRFWLKKSGFEKWEQLFDGCILFRTEGRAPVHVISLDNSKFYSANCIMFKKKHVTCREVVQRCLDKCMKNTMIYVTDPTRREMIVLLKPFQSLEELLVEIDLSCSAEDALDDVR